MRKISKTIADIDDGGLQKKMDYEFSKVMSSINDEKADTSKSATIDIRIKFSPSSDRKVVSITYGVKSKLLPSEAKAIAMYNTQAVDENGVLHNVLKDVSENANGQIDIFGSINELTEIAYENIEEDEKE